MAGREERIKLAVETVLHERGLVDAKTRLVALERQLGITQRTTTAATSSMVGAFTRFSGVLAGVFSTRALTTFVAHNVVDVWKLEQAYRGITATLRAMGASAESELPKVRELIDQLSAMRGLGHVELARGFNKLLGLTENVDAAMAGLRLTVDAARMTGLDFGAALEAISAILAGRAASGARILNVNLKLLGEEGANSAEGIRKLQERVEEFNRTEPGASAKAARLRGSFQKLGLAVGESFSAAGQKSVGVIKGLLEKLSVDVPFYMSQFYGAMAESLPVLEEIADGIAGMFGKQLKLGWAERAEAEAKRLFEIALENTKERTKAEAAAASFAADQAAELVRVAQKRDAKARKEKADAEAAARERERIARVRDEIKAELEVLNARLDLVARGSKEEAEIRRAILEKRTAAELIEAEQSAAALANRRVAAALQAGALERQIANEGLTSRLRIEAEAAAARVRAAEEVAQAVEREVGAERAGSAQIDAIRAASLALYAARREQLMAQMRVELADENKSADEKLAIERRFFAQLYALYEDYRRGARDVLDQNVADWAAAGLEISQAFLHTLTNQEEELADYAARGTKQRAKRERKAEDLRLANRQKAEELAAIKRLGSEAKAQAALVEIQRHYDSLRGEISRARAEEDAALALQAIQESLAVLARHFPQFKGFALAQAFINMREGVTKAWGQGGALGAVGAALVVAACMVQIAEIMSTEPPKAERGGIVTLETLARVGERGRPEAILPLDSAHGRAILARALGDALGAAQPPPLVQQHRTDSHVSQTWTQHFHGFLIDERSLRRAARLMRRADRLDRGKRLQ